MVVAVAVAVLLLAVVWSSSLRICRRTPLTRRASFERLDSLCVRVCVCVCALV